MPPDHALPGPQAKATAAVGLFQLQPHYMPDRQLLKYIERRPDLQFSFDLTGQVGYTGAMAAQFIAGEVYTGGDTNGLLGLVSNPPPGTPTHVRRAFKQLANALTSVPPPNYNPQHPLYEGEHAMAQMPLQRRPTKADAQKLMAEGARILNEIDDLRAKYLGGVEPTTDGAVVTFQRSFPNDLDTFYSYAAMRADGKWYLTGTMGSIAFTWDELLYWCEDGTTRDFHLISDNAFQPALPSAEPVVDGESASGTTNPTPSPVVDTEA